MPTSSRRNARCRVPSRAGRTCPTRRSDGRSMRISSAAASTTTRSTPWWAPRAATANSQLARDIAGGGPIERRDSLVEAAPAIGVVLFVEHRFPTRRSFRREVIGGHLFLIGRKPVALPELLRQWVRQRPLEIDQAVADIQSRLLAQLARRGLDVALAVLHDSRDDVPVVLVRATEDQHLIA